MGPSPLGWSSRPSRLPASRPLSQHATLPDVLPPSVAVVVLGLGSAFGWGVSDFLGGLTTRRAPLLGVLVVTQLLGVLIAIPLAVLNGESLPLPADIGWSVLSGILGVIGLGCLYHGLGVGRMGVVAPVTGVIVAVSP